MPCHYGKPALKYEEPANSRNRFPPPTLTPAATLSPTHYLAIPAAPRARAHTRADPAAVEDQAQQAAGAQPGDQEREIAHIGGQGAGPVTVAVAEPLFRALMVFGTEHGGDLKLDQLLQAMAGQLGNSSPAALPSSRDARAEAAESGFGVVWLVG